MLLFGVGVIAIENKDCFSVLGIMNLEGTVHLKNILLAKYMHFIAILVPSIFITQILFSMVSVVS